MTINLNRILIALALVCTVVAFIITVGWVTAEGNARDAWFLAGVSLFFGAHLT